MLAFHNYVSKPFRTFFCLMSNKDLLFLKNTFIELSILKMLYCNTIVITS